MKRTLIDYDVLKKMESSSLSAAERELLEATDVLAEALGEDDLQLHCYGDESVLYETYNGDFIHANYIVEDSNITFDNIENLVVDEDSHKAQSRQHLSSLVEALLDDNEDSEVRASAAFDDYISDKFVRRNFVEGEQLEEEDINEDAFTVRKSKPTKRGAGRGKKQPRSLVNKRTRARNKTLRKLSPSAKKRSKRERDRLGKSLGGNKRARVVLRYKKPTGAGALAAMKNEHVKSLSSFCENVNGYLNFREMGPVLQDTIAKRDDKGNIEALRIPTLQARNEVKLLKFNWDVLDHETKMLRAASTNLSENADFCKAVADLRRQNALSDNGALEESLDTIASNWPGVIYLTQNELAKVVSESLSTVGVGNWDDQMCEFMAEGILRKVHSAYTDRVDKILKLAGSDIKTEGEEDSYIAFQKVVANFYPKLDESRHVEMQVFVDLYNTVREIQEVANNVGDEILAEDAGTFLRDLHAVVTEDVQPDIELAEDVAEWLTYLIETNLETQSWDVKNAPHMTVSGDHPDMAKKAKQGYTPSKDGLGDYGDVAPVSDGKSYRGGLADEMRNRSYGNFSKETFPSLKNPYVPAPYGDYTMKGEPGVDKSNSGFSLHHGDTWPELQNPYVPTAIGADGWKMKSDNLVIDQ